MVFQRLSRHGWLPAALFFGLCFLSAVAATAGPAPAADAPAAIIHPAVSKPDPLALADLTAPDVQVAGSAWEWWGGGNLRDIQFLNATQGWIIGNVGPLRTTDGGATWVALTGLSAYDLNDLQFTDAQNGWAVGKNGAILHTTNGGATWAPQASGVTQELTRVSFVDNLWGWIRGDGDTLRRTTDGGQTWTPVPFDVGEWKYVSDVSFIDRNIGWVSTADGSIIYVQRTSDGGATWTPSQPPYSVIGCNNSNVDRTLFFLDALHGWVMCRGDDGMGSVYGLTYRTTDGGVTWREPIGAGGPPEVTFFASLDRRLDGRIRRHLRHH